MIVTRLRAWSAPRYRTPAPAAHRIDNLMIALEIYHPACARLVGFYGAGNRTPAACRRSQSTDKARGCPTITSNTPQGQCNACAGLRAAITQSNNGGSSKPIALLRATPRTSARGFLPWRFPDAPHQHAHHRPARHPKLHTNGPSAGAPERRSTQSPDRSALHVGAECKKDAQKLALRSRDFVAEISADINLQNDRNRVSLIEGWRFTPPDR